MSDLWSDRLIPFAYQYQKEAKPFKEMMTVFGKQVLPQKDMTILDIGCGSGRIITLLIDDLKLDIKSVVGIDISKHALKYGEKNVNKIKPPFVNVKFIHADISSQDWADPLETESFDLVTAGLSIQYAQHWDKQTRQWTTKAYERVLQNIFALLKPGGQFVCSVNVPNHDFSVIAKASVKEIFTPLWKFPFRVFVAIIMVRQGKQLTKEANNGRFLYLPIEQVCNFLKAVGFQQINYTLTYRGLAWVISCFKPAQQLHNETRIQAY